MPGESKKKFSKLSELLTEPRRYDSVNVSLCFGHFNVIHPGHIRYFRAAKQHGNQLVVALEGDSQLSKSERTEIFSEVERAEAVSELDIIDHVVILDKGSLAELIEIIRPSILVLGKEFEGVRFNKVRDAVDKITQQDGEVTYSAGETHYAGSDLFFVSQNELEKTRWNQFKIALKNQDINFPNLLKKFTDKKPIEILVIGDTIVDQYVACDPIGMSNEAPVIVVKELESREFVGGAGIVAAHIAALGAKATFISITGKDRNAEFVEDSLQNYGVATHLLVDESRPTTYKIRYMAENQKLFRVSRLKEHGASIEVEEKIIHRILDLAPSISGIVVCDFVYGVITPRILSTIQRISKENNLPLFGDLQCSSQVGNVAKFKDFELLCPTEREARIALSNHDDGVEYLANLLIQKTRVPNLILKLGAEGFIAYSLGKMGGESQFLRRQYFPALSVNPVDVAGAGDSLLAALSVGMMSGFSTMESAALGSCVAAIGVMRTGNLPVQIEELRKFSDWEHLRDQ